MKAVRKNDEFGIMHPIKQEPVLIGEPVYFDNIDVCDGEDVRAVNDSDMLCTECTDMMPYPRTMIKRATIEYEFCSMICACRWCKKNPVKGIGSLLSIKSKP